MSKLIDLTNQQFGNWTVLYYTGNSKWHCRCSCGVEKDVNTVSLRKGTSKSCGCEKVKNARINNGKYKDESGNRYGKLVVIAKDEELSIQKHRAQWVCKCDCGNLKTVSSKCLREGKTKSCGCASRSSFGEMKIEELLFDLNIPFQTQYGVSINKKWYKFDFAILNNNKTLKCFLEYDGSQHFDNSHLHWGKTSEQVQFSDKIKNNYCKEKNIPLIRISYIDYNKLDENYLLKLIQEVENNG